MKLNDNTQLNNIPSSALQLVSLLQSNGYEAYLVGGCVRDLCLDRKPHDWDMCTNATPNEIINVLKENKMNFHTVGEKFGTITALLEDEYEITTYRSEASYSDGRHPDNVVFETDIHKDLMRRDFSINAMAYDPVNKQLIDDYNGISDIKNGVIRCVGDAAQRFNEDALRILRAIRFAVKYEFQINKDTSDAIHKNISLLNNVSKERITRELKSMLTCNKPIRNLFLEYKDVVSQIIPELIPCFNFEQNNRWHKHDVFEHMLHVVDNCNTDKFEIKLAALLHDIAKPTCCSVDEDGWYHFYGHPEASWEMSKRVISNDLALTVTERILVQNLIRHHDMEIPQTYKSVKRMLSKFNEDFINDWLILKQADISDHCYDNIPAEKRKNIETLDADFINVTINDIKQKNSCLSIKDLSVDGKILMKEFNLKPGKIIGEILNQLLNEVIEEQIDNEKEKLLIRAKELYENRCVSVKEIDSLSKSSLENSGTQNICKKEEIFR